MKIETDLHVHTVASGHAYSTVEEIARAARDKGLKAVAISDHGPAIPGGAHLYHFWNMKVLPEEMNGVRILRGAEANIVDEKGSIDLDSEVLEVLDLVHAGFHPRCGYEARDPQTNTQALIGAMKNPYVDIIVHPGNPKFPVDAEALVEAALKNEVFLEINNSSFLESTARRGSFELELAIAEEACKRGVEVVISSDAHLASGVGEFGEAIKIAEQAGYSEDQVFNSSLERVLSFIASKKKRLLT